MNCKRFTCISITILTFLFLLSGYAVSATKSAKKPVAVKSQKVVEKPIYLQDLSTVDVSDIEVKAHNWVNNGYGVRWSPDGSYVVFCRPNDGFYVMDPLCQNIRDIGKGMFFEGMSPDGSILYGSRSMDGSFKENIPAKGLFAINLKDSKVKQIGDFEFSTSKWSPNGKFVAIELSTGEWAIVNIHSGKTNTLRKELGGILANIYLPWERRWSLDGNKFLYDAYWEVFVFDANKNTTNIITKGSDCGWIGNTNKIWARTPDKKNIAVMNSDGTESNIIESSYVYFSPLGSWAIARTNGLKEVAIKIADKKTIELIESEKSGISKGIYPIWFPNENKFLFPYKLDANYLNTPCSWYIFSLNTAEGLTTQSNMKFLGSEENPWLCPSLSPNSRLISFITNKSSDEVSNTFDLGISDDNAEKHNILAKMNIKDLDWTYSHVTPQVWSPLGNAIAYSGYTFRDSGIVGVVILGKKDKK